MSETWYVYRHSIMDAVLQADQTQLDVTPGVPNCMANFKLVSGPIDVEMVVDRTTGALHGMDGTGRLHFRWSCIGSGEDAILIGQIFDETKPNKSRDFFVGVKSERLIPLPLRQKYDFSASYLMPFSRAKSSDELGEIRVDCASKKINFKGLVYKITEDGNHSQGRKLLGWYDKDGDEPMSLELWILPLDGTGRLLATGCHSHWDAGAAGMKKFNVFKRPLDPGCVNGIQPCNCVP